MMASPDAASETACLMVLQAVVGDLQLLLLFPVTPFTYRVVLATAVSTPKYNISAATHINFLYFIISSLRCLLRSAAVAGAKSRTRTAAIERCGRRIFNHVLTSRSVSLSQHALHQGNCHVSDIDMRPRSADR